MFLNILKKIQCALDVILCFTNNPHTQQLCGVRPRHFVTTSSRVTIVIPADHPSLPGHFPGRPIVPGAIILAEIAQAALRILNTGARITGFPSIKFVSPMLPEHRCELTLTDNRAGCITFELRYDTQRVANGSLRYERDPPLSP